MARSLAWCESANAGAYESQAGSRTWGRQRFSVAHELGHFRSSTTGLRLQVAKNGPCWTTRASLKNPRRISSPSNFCCLKSWYVVAVRYPRSTCDRFRSLRTTSKRQLRQPRFASLSSRPRCVPLFTRRRVASDGRERVTAFGSRLIGWGQPLEPASLAIDFFQKGAVPEEPEEVRGDAWIESSSGRAPEVVEHSMAIPSIGLS